MVPRLSRVPKVGAAIADEVATAFRQALGIRDHREDELADGNRCLGIGLCETCDEYERLVAIVDAALKVTPAELSPLDVIDGPAPPMWCPSSRPTGTELEISTWHLPRLLGPSHGQRR